METPSAVLGRKRALEDGDASPRALPENKNIIPQLLEAQVGLPASIGSLPGGGNASAKRGRVTGAVESRRVEMNREESSEPIIAPLTALSGSISPVLRVFTNNTDAAKSPSQTGNTPIVSSPFEMKKAAEGLENSMFFLGGTQRQYRPTIPLLGTSGLVPEHKTSPVAHLRKLGGGAVNHKGMDVSPRGNPKKKSLVLEGRTTGTDLLKTCGLPTISHFLGASGHTNSTNLPVLGSLNTPYREPAVVPTTMSSSKQEKKIQPFPFTPQHKHETKKEARTSVLDPSEVLNVSNAPLQSFNTDDFSSDEELIGIPGPDILDLEVSYSQDKLGDLSVTENNLEETVVLILCDGLANSLTKVERERMELLNLFTIALAQQPSPITLGREQFQDVFGDNIRGGSLSHLSQRHCLLHVRIASSQENCANMDVTVRIEDTSTNGTWVNGMQLKNGQTHELDLGDIVTLLRIRRDEDDVSLAYKLVRGDPLPEQSTRESRKSRRDGRYVIPSDKFLCESADVSNRCGLSPVQESDISLLHAIPARANMQTMHYYIPAGAEAHFSTTNKVEMRNPQQPLMLSRKILCTVLFADQSTQTFSESSQPLEEASFDYRECLSEVFSPFTSIHAFDASSYRCATTESLQEAVHDRSDVLFYTGGGDETHLVVEAPSGLAARLEKGEVFQLLSGAKSAMRKLIIVISPSRRPACLLAKCGAPHVCYLSSASKHSLRVTAFIRALCAGLLKGFSVEKSYTLAEFVALNDLLPIMRPSDQICEMLPTSEQHDIQIGSILTEAVEIDISVIVLLNGPFIPVLATHFLGRDAVVEKVKAALGQKVRVCNIYGARGVGKSSIAIHIAKTVYRTKSYRNGVHYFAVDRMLEHIQNSINSELIDCQSQGCLQPNQREDALPKVMGEVETLLRSLPETDSANYPNTLVVLDGCDVVLPALEVFVRNIIGAFAGIQILITSTEHVRIYTDDDEVMPKQAIHIEELGKLDSAKLFLKQARGHLTSRQFRQYFPDSSIEAISDDERLLGTKGNPFLISRLVYELESQTDDQQPSMLQALASQTRLS